MVLLVVWRLLCWRVWGTDYQCFSYDYQRHLVAAWTPSLSAGCATAPSQANLAGPTPYWTAWTIDTVGKVTSRTDKTKSTSSTTSYTHPADGATSVRPHATTASATTGSAPGSRSYSYDAAGNLTGRPGPGGVQQTLTWDENGQLSDVSQNGVSVAKMVYDATGQRIARQQNGVYTLYVAGAELTLTGSTVTATRNYSHNGFLVASRTGNTDTSVTSIVTDHQGTPHAQVDNATGKLTIAWQDPYGQPRGTTGGTWTGDKGFVGGTKDATGLTRIGARDYDPSMGQFLSVDPIHDTGDPLLWNPYVYAANNPITMSDPSGLWPSWLEGPIDIGLRIGVAAVVAVHDFTSNFVGNLGTMPVATATAPSPQAPSPKAPSSAKPAPAGKHRSPGHKKAKHRAAAPKPKRPAPKPSTSWKQVWDQANAKERKSDPKGFSAHVVFAAALGAAATTVTEMSGGNCYRDATGLNVCSGGIFPASRGGTTYGDTFIARLWNDPAAERAKNSQGYKDTLEHESNHTRQWLNIGPVMGPGYLLDEAGASIAEKLTGRSSACFNIFEVTADAKLGGYPC